MGRHHKSIIKTAEAEADVRAFKHALGLTVQRARKRRGWTLAQLGRRAGVNPLRIDHLELGRGQFSLSVAALVAGAFGQPLSIFLNVPTLD